MLQMCSLKGRDAQGYPQEGIDECGPYPPTLKEVVTKSNAKETQGNDTLTRLVQLLKAANEREDYWKDMNDTLQRKYNALYQDYMALKYSDICVSCQKEQDSTPAGETITLCHCCGEGKNTLKSLKLELEKVREETRYWQDCYENKLQMDEVMMVPVDEFNWLSNYYQGKITESALLDKAGHLAAEQQLILQDKNIPSSIDSIAVQIVKPMALQQGRLVKRVRTGTAAPSEYEGVEEPEGMADAPTDRLLKEIIEITDDTPVKTVKKERTTPKTSFKKATVKKTKPAKKKRALPATPTPGPSRIKTIPKSISDKAKQALRDLGWIEGQDSPKGAAKAYKKRKKTEVETLKEGWEPWTKPPKRGPLNYETDEEAED